ncbi:hypothetical protein D9M71_682360 [compost metagenome]
MQHLLAVRTLQQRPGPVAGQPLQLRRHAHPQVDHEAALRDRLAVAGVEHRATAGGDQLSLAGQQLPQHLAFVLAEAGLARMLEDGRNAGPGRVDDGLVGIHEVQGEALGKTPADAGFAGAHRANQDEVRSGIHYPEC